MNKTLIYENQQLKPIVMKVTQSRINAYGRVSVDFNAIHIDQEFASQSLVGKTRSEDMLIAAVVSDHMSENFSELWAESGR